MVTIKEILFKKHFIREILMLFFIVLSLLFISIYTSFAIFENSYEKSSVASIVVPDINLTLSTSTSPAESLTKNIVVLAGEKSFIDLTVSNISNIDAKYKLYYTISETNDGVTVGVTNTSLNLESSTLNSVGNNNSKKTIRIGINNTSTSDVTVTLGVQSGFIRNEIVLNSDRNQLGSIEEVIEPCEVGNENTLACKILGSNYANVITTKPTYSSTSTDRGLYVQQGDATKSINGVPTYYFRGSTSNDSYNMNNYVSFGTYKTVDGGNTVDEPIIWRVVRINEDRTIKLITENPISDYVIWNSLNTSNYVNNNNTDSEVKSGVESWYNSNIGNNAEIDNKVVTSTFCNDIDTNIGERLLNNTPTPTFVCSENSIMVNKKVGLITADELVYAGGYMSTVQDNTTYLNNGVDFWTMTAQSNTSIFRFHSGDSNLIDYQTANANNMGKIRAVINLKSDVNVSDGDGLTKSTAYIIQ